MIRPFGWRDLPTLYRYRHQGVYLDSALQATRGSSLFPGGLFSVLTSVPGLGTWVCKEDCDEMPLIGQFHHHAETPSARLSFLAPKEALDTSSIQLLLEQLAKQAGQRSAFHLLAETEPESQIYEKLRKAGFTAYTRQRIWQWKQDTFPQATNRTWRWIEPIDIIPVQSLYRNIVPENIQHLESVNSIPQTGLVYRDGGDLIAFAEVKYGDHGIWLRPYLSPDIEDAESTLIGLLHSVADRGTRPIYLSMRAYQSLEPDLESLGAIPGPIQTALVKHLAAHHKLRDTFTLPNLEGRSEASAPLAHTTSRRN